MILKTSSTWFSGVRVLARPPAPVDEDLDHETSDAPFASFALQSSSFSQRISPGPTSRAAYFRSEHGQVVHVIARTPLVVLLLATLDSDDAM
jgi:hypothetical protein